MYYLLSSLRIGLLYVYRRYASSLIVGGVSCIHLCLSTARLEQARKDQETLKHKIHTDQGGPETPKGLSSRRHRSVLNPKGPSSPREPWFLLVDLHCNTRLTAPLSRSSGISCNFPHLCCDPYILLFENLKLLKGLRMPESSGLSRLLYKSTRLTLL